MIDAWEVVKIIVCFSLGFYFLFAWLVVRQVNLLNSMLGTNLSTAFRLVALLHLILAAGLFVFSLLVL